MPKLGRSLFWVIFLYLSITLNILQGFMWLREIEARPQVFNP